MPVLNPNEKAAAEKIANRPLTPAETLAHEYGRRDRAESADVNMQRSNFRPVVDAPIQVPLVTTLNSPNGHEVRLSQTIDSLEQHKAEAAQLLEAERVERMSPAEKRSYFIDRDLAKYRQEQADAKVLRAWERTNKDKLDTLQSLYDQLKWRDDVSAEDLWLIERAQRQIQAGPNASKAATDKFFAEAMGVPARLVQEADRVAQEHLARAEQTRALAQLGAFNPTVKVPPVVNDEQPAPVADVSEAHRLLDRSQAFKAAGLQEEANDLLMQSIESYCKANPGHAKKLWEAIHG